MTQSPIYFQEECFDYLNQFIETSSPTRVFILVDENTHQHCIPYFLGECYAIENPEILEVESGEVNKTLETVNQLYWSLTELGADRNSLIINLGGGVITDMGGFLASTFKRGLSFVNVPTTLLSMVDASVGGKTGVDLGIIKNQVGTFSMAEMVLIIPEFLETLEPRHLLAGFAEMLKHGLIQKESFWIEMKQLKKPDSSNIIPFIQNAIAIKKEIVELDPLEKGLRKILNFGHTFGHAIESLFLNTDKELLHGEAVLVGMHFEAELSNQYCGLQHNEKQEIQAFIEELFPIPELHENQIDDILSLMKNDKKNSGSAIQFSLLEQIGRCAFNIAISPDDLKEHISTYIKK